MRVDKLELNLYGQSSEKYEYIKKEISNYLVKIKLPLVIVEKNSISQVKAIYKANEFILSESNQLQIFFDFLLKINPKTGKICKCSDCDKCPSKRLEAVLAKQQL